MDNQLCREILKNRDIKRQRKIDEAIIKKRKSMTNKSYFFFCKNYLPPIPNSTLTIVVANTNIKTPTTNGINDFLYSAFS